jgi:hypothetical protein
VKAAAGRLASKGAAWRVVAVTRWFALSALMLAVVVAGCGASGDRPDDLVRDYLQARVSTSCQYLTAPQAKLCRLLRVPDPPATAVVVDSMRIDGNRASIRASYDWTGYRRHSTFALIRREDGWLIVRETPLG